MTVPGWEKKRRGKRLRFSDTGSRWYRITGLKNKGERGYKKTQNEDKKVRFEDKKSIRFIDTVSINVLK